MEAALFIAIFQQINFKSGSSKYVGEQLVIVNNLMVSRRMIFRARPAYLDKVLIRLVWKVGVWNSATQVAMRFEELVTMGRRKSPFTFREMFPNVFTEKRIYATLYKTLLPIFTPQQVQLFLMGGNPAFIRLLTGSNNDFKRLPRGNAANTSQLTSSLDQRSSTSCRAGTPPCSSSRMKPLNGIPITKHHFHKSMMLISRSRLSHIET